MLLTIRPPVDNMYTYTTLNSHHKECVMNDFNLAFDADRDQTDAEMFAEADAREELGFLESGESLEAWEEEYEAAQRAEALANSDSGDDEDFEPEYDDSMDGDHDSAMRDCGWGTDEDYGYYGDSDLGGEY